MPATINDVAKKANVSISTVSKVLKNYQNISGATRDKVLQAVKELNYIPNSMASALSSKNFIKVALYIYINDQKQAIDEINMQYLQGAFKQASQIQMNVITVFNETVKNLNADELTRYFLSQGINALVVYGLNKEDHVIHEIIEKKTFYTVVVDSPIFNDKTSSVSVDHEKGQYAVAKQMLKKPFHKKILYLAGKQNGYVTDQRLAGIQKLCHELDVELEYVFADFSEKKAFNTVLEKGSYFDAIVCASDLMVIGSVQALRKMNIYRSCCGYDGISLMGYAGQNILTCKQNFYQVSMTAILELQRLLDGEKGRLCLLPFEIASFSYEEVIF